MTEGEQQLEATIKAYIQDRKQFVRGFARFVIEKGHGAVSPRKNEKGKLMSWQGVGRLLYGADLFNTVFREELTKLNGDPHAESGLSPVRGDQGEGAEAGRSPGGGEDLGGEDHEFQGEPSSSIPPAAQSQAALI